MKNDKPNNFLKPLGIIVEGDSDKKFFSKICEHKDVALKNFQIEQVSPRGGKTGFFGKDFFYDTTNIERLIKIEKKTKENSSDLRC